MRRQYHSVMTGRVVTAADDKLVERHIEESFARRVWLECALLDLRREFPAITPDNFEAADAFRVARSNELLAAVGIR